MGARLGGGVGGADTDLTRTGTDGHGRTRMDTGGTRGDTDGVGMLIYSVGEISAYLKALLEQDEQLGDVWVSGEVSNCRPAPSGRRI